MKWWAKVNVTARAIVTGQSPLDRRRWHFHLTTQEKPIRLGFATIDPLEQGLDGKFLAFLLDDKLLTFDDEGTGFDWLGWKGDH